VCDFIPKLDKALDVPREIVEIKLAMLCLDACKEVDIATLEKALNTGRPRVPHPVRKRVSLNSTSRERYSMCPKGNVSLVDL
jgi:hypothetical protein